jgi:hypothetical protein
MAQAAIATGKYRYPAVRVELVANARSRIADRRHQPYTQGACQQYRFNKLFT